MKKSMIGLLAVLGVVGCGIIGLDCDDDFQPGIVMTVVDSISGGPVPGEATATATEGAYLETVAVPDDTPFTLAENRAGTYDVEVTAPDYRTWMRTGVTVQVSGNSCSVNRVRLTALLQPEEEEGT